MTEPASQARIDAANVYEALFVPAPRMFTTHRRKARFPGIRAMVRVEFDSPAHIVAATKP